MYIFLEPRGVPPRLKREAKRLEERSNGADAFLSFSKFSMRARFVVFQLQVSAMDRDEGANGRVRYSIAMGDDNRDFTISEDGGVIRVAKNLNFERKSRYYLTIRGEDCASEVGETPRGDTAQVTVTVLDINDNAPVFLDSPYLAHVMENMVPPGGGFVIQVNNPSNSQSLDFNPLCSKFKLSKFLYYYHGKL